MAIFEICSGSGLEGYYSIAKLFVCLDVGIVLKEIQCYFFEGKPNFFLSSPKQSLHRSGIFAQLYVCRMI